MQEAQILTHGLHWALAHLWHNFALNEMGTYLLNPTVHYGPPICAQSIKCPIKIQLGAGRTTRICWLPKNKEEMGDSKRS